MKIDFKYYNISLFMECDIIFLLQTTGNYFIVTTYYNIGFEKVLRLCIFNV